MIPKGLDFTKKQFDEIDKILYHLFWETEAQSVMLSDITGQLVSVLGESNINTVPLSVLAAGNLATTKEIARLIGEPANFKLMLHEGDTRSVYLSDVGDDLFLIAVFGKSTPIGLVRLSTQNTVRKLLKIVEAAITNTPNDLNILDDKSDRLIEALGKSFDEIFGNTD